MSSKTLRVRWFRVLAAVLALGAVGFGVFTAVRGLRTASALVHPARIPVTRPSGPDALAGLE
ncbi:alpha/beta hydrolase, partial [Rhizobium leguminosarum]|nr:alpha/beta hydrolase [Rhizobium ruizarguesonis]